MKIVKCLIPRRCRVCDGWGGWKNPTIDSIEEWDYDDTSVRNHHHKACIADAICNADDYHISRVKIALHIFDKINEIDKEETKERVKYKQKLAEAQTELCKQGG